MHDSFWAFFYVHLYLFPIILMTAFRVFTPFGEFPFGRIREKNISSFSVLTRSLPSSSHIFYTAGEPWQ